MNKVIISGRVTKDIEVNYTASQMAVARFSLALDKGKDKDGNSRGADYPNVVVFGRTAENLEKFSGKGLRLEVEGHIQTGSYEDKNGTKHYTTDVVAERIEFIDWKNSGQTAQETAGNYPQGFAAIDEEIPF